MTVNILNQKYLRHTIIQAEENPFYCFVRLIYESSPSRAISIILVLVNWLDTSKGWMITPLRNYKSRDSARNNIRCNIKFN